MKRTIFLALALVLLALSFTAAFAAAPTPPAPAPDCLPVPVEAGIVDHAFGWYSPDANTTVCQVSWYDGQMYTIVAGQPTTAMPYSVWLTPQMLRVEAVCDGDTCPDLSAAWVYVRIKAPVRHTVSLPLLIK